MKNKLIAALLITGSLFGTLNAQEKGDPKATEYYSPVPKIVTPAKNPTGAPSDAIILFGFSDL